MMFDSFISKYLQQLPLKKYFYFKTKNFIRLSSTVLCGRISRHSNITMKLRNAPKILPLSRIYGIDVA